MTGKVSFEQDNSWLVRLVRATLQIFKGYFIVVGVCTSFFVLFIFLAIVGASYSSSNLETSTSRSIDENMKYSLQVRFDGELANRSIGPGEQFWNALLDEKPKLYVPSFRATLRRAKADPAIGGLEIELLKLTGSTAEIVELRNAISDFRESGKPVRVFLSDESDWNYFLASAADEIVMAPAASLFLSGPAFTLVYFSEALKKLGVGIDVLRVGKFKSAIEPFLRMTPSEAALEQYESMERSLRDYMVQVVAEDRGVDQVVAQRWFRESIYTADAALQEGLVDAVGYMGDTIDSIAKTTLPPERLKYRTYQQLDRSQYDWEQGDEEGGIALIEAIGEIVMSKDGGDGEGISPNGLTKQLRWAKDNDDVKAVVLRVSSPGGSALASDMIWKDVRDLAAIKPVVVSMGGAAASGGYYISAPATHIVAEPTTITGSIGVFGMVPNAKPFEEKYGVAFHVVTQTERANLLNPGEALSSFDRTIIEVTLDRIYNLFISKVGEGRGLTPDQVDDIGQGRVYTGLEALQIGLVDSLGGIQEAFTKAKELAKLDPAKLYEVMTYQPDELSLRDCLMRPDRWDRCLREPGTKIFQSALPKDPVSVWQKRLERWVSHVQHGQAMAVWPGWWATSMGQQETMGTLVGGQN